MDSKCYYETKKQQLLHCVEEINLYCVVEALNSVQFALEEITDILSVEGDVGLLENYIESLRRKTSGLASGTLLVRSIRGGEYSPRELKTAVRRYRQFCDEIEADLAQRLEAEEEMWEDM